MAGAEKRRLTEQKNTVRMGLAETADSTVEWREVGAQVIGDAIKWVEANGFPVFVSFDNDLGERQPERRCFAAWLLELDMDSGDMPEDFAFYVHSQNVVVADHIRSRIDGHLAERTREKPAGRPWPPQRPREPWGRLG